VALRAQSARGGRRGKRARGVRRRTHRRRRARGHRTLRAAEFNATPREIRAAPKLFSHQTCAAGAVMTVYASHRLIVYTGPLADPDASMELRRMAEHFRYGRWTGIRLRLRRKDEQSG
jgi:hypothetical protein